MSRIAYRLTEAGVRGAVPEGLSQSILSRQLLWLDALTEFPDTLTVELRIEAVPRQEFRRASLRISVIVDVGETPAGSDVRPIQRAAASLLPFDLGVYSFEETPLDDWPAGHCEIAEIVRREEILALPGQVLTLVHPFPAPSPTHIEPLLSMLELRESRTALCVVLRPARLLPFERDYLRTALALLETKSGARGRERGVSGDESVAPRKMFQDQLAEGRSLLLLRAFVVSDAPLDPGLLSLAGASFSRTSDTSRHTYTLRTPVDSNRRAELVSQLVRHRFDPFEPTVAAPECRRLLYLFDPTEALSVFRLPLPGPNGKVGSLPFPAIRTFPTSMDAPTDGIRIGDNVHHGVRTPVYLSRDDARRHVYMPGQTGTGKSTLMREMILQDIHAGEGVVLLDPHGDLAESVLPDIPRSRADDLVYFNPIDRELPLGLNVLDGRGPEESQILVSQAVSMFLRMFGWEVFGPRLQDYFRHMALSLMTTDEGGTLLDIVSFVRNEPFRKRVVDELRKSESDPLLLEFWNQYDLQGERERTEMIPFWAAKFSSFYAEPVMRHIICQARPRWRVAEDVLDRKGILIANLAKGAVGEENSRLLGATLMAQIQTAAMLRARRPKGDRVPFRLYVDEFQNYASSEFSTLLSEGRKFGLSMVLANQFMSQISRFTRYGEQVDVLGAVLGNVGNLIAFRTGASDAEFLEHVFGGRYRAEELAALPNFHAVTRLLSRGQVGEATNVQTLLTPPAEAGEYIEALKGLSRLKYGVPALKVASNLEQRVQA